MNRIRKNIYLYFASRVLFMLCFLYLLDHLIGETLRYFYFKEKSGREYRATYAMEQAKADVLIFGASRAYRHYVPKIIEDSLKLSCYNTGTHAQSIFYDYAVLKSILKRYTPKIIILDIVPDELQISDESYDRLAFLEPYYKSHEEIRPIVELRGPFERYKLLSSVYPFNSDLVLIAGGNLDYIKEKYSDQEGYKPEVGTWTKSIRTINPHTYPIDSKKLLYYKLFIQDCKKAGIKLFLAYSPTYGKFTNPDYTVSILKKVAEDEKLGFADFSNNTAFINHPELYRDPLHLNGNGAEIYTPMIIHKIKESLKY